MTRSQRKVAIAKDVIANIMTNSLNIEDETGYITGLDVTLTTKKEVQIAIPLIKKKCQMCARGAMVICKIDKFNNCGLLNLQNFGRNDTSKILKDAFTDKELEAIEAAFERAYPWDATINYIDYLDQCVYFGMAFSDPTDRLLAIMQNIVDHKGEFKPEVKYEICKG